jgi:hypothetical protein
MPADGMSAATEMKSGTPARPSAALLADYISAREQERGWLCLFLAHFVIPRQRRMYVAFGPKRTRTGKHN